MLVGAPPPEVIVSTAPVVVAPKCGGIHSEYGLYTGACSTGTLTMKSWEKYEMMVHL